MKSHLVPHLSAFPFLLLLLLFCALTSVFAASPQSQQPLFHVLLLLPNPSIMKKQEWQHILSVKGWHNKLSFSQKLDIPIWNVCNMQILFLCTCNSKMASTLSTEEKHNLSTCVCTVSQHLSFIVTYGHQELSIQKILL